MIYTKSEIAELLKMPADRADNIKRELTKRGYKYTVSGHGSTYLFNIISKPTEDLSWFAQTYFGFKPRNIIHFAHFLNFLFTTGVENKTASWSSYSISRRTYYSKDTVRKYLTAIIKSEALIQAPMPTFFATKYFRDATEDPNIERQYHVVREISKEEYDMAFKAFFETYNKLMNNIDYNPNMIPELARYTANIEKANVLDGWWVQPGCCDYIYPNIYWPHIKQLLSLLAEYPYEDYFEYTMIDLEKEAEERERAEEVLQMLLEEKRNKVDNLLNKRYHKLVSDIPEDVKQGSIDDYMKYLEETGFNKIYKEISEENGRISNSTWSQWA